MIHIHLSVPVTNGLRANNCESYTIFIEKDITMDTIKEKWSELGVKDKIAYSTAVACFSLGWLLVIAGFIAPPLGEVTPSVISIFGASLTYTGTILGIGLKFHSDLIKFKQQIREEIDDKE